MLCEERDGSAGKNAKIATVELRIKSQTLVDVLHIGNMCLSYKLEGGFLTPSLLSDRTLESSDWWGLRNSSAPWPPLIWCGEVTKDGGNPSKHNPRSGHSDTIVHHCIKHLKGSHTVIAKLPLWQQGGWKSRQALSCEKWSHLFCSGTCCFFITFFFSLQNWKALKYRWNVYIQLQQPVITRNRIKFIKMTKVGRLEDCFQNRVNFFALFRKKMERPGYPGFWMQSTKSKYKTL